jgi:hypothetical protein
MAEYRFSEQPAPNGEVRLEWAKDEKLFDPLDFWIVPSAEIEQAKERVRAGEFDG